MIVAVIMRGPIDIPRCRCLAIDIEVYAVKIWLSTFSFHASYRYPEARGTVVIALIIKHF